MHALTVNYNQTGTQTFLFNDPAKAKKAYEALKAALIDYRPFKNDKTEIVEFDDGVESTTVRIESLLSVSLSDCEKDEATQAQFAEWQGRLMGARDKAKNAIAELAK